MNLRIDYEVDASDPGKAAQANYAAAVLFARVSGMNAENKNRTNQGYAFAYTADAFEEAIEDAWAATHAGMELSKMREA